MNDERTTTLEISEQRVTVRVACAGQRWFWNYSDFSDHHGFSHRNSNWQPLSTAIYDGEKALEEAVKHVQNLACGPVLIPGAADDLRGIHREAFLRTGNFDGCDHD